METFCATTGRSKYRPTLTSNSFYQTAPYNPNFRQNDYTLANSSRHSALLWHEMPQPNVPKSNDKSCSIALAAASFIVLVGVLSIAGLALYMGALRTETPSPLLMFSCSVKVTSGDRFIVQLQEKARKYKVQLETLYQRSLLGPAFISCVVEKFGNDTRTLYYRLMLNRRKIPRTITNIEKTVRDILLSDAVTRKPIFKNIRFDARSVNVRLTTETDSYQRAVAKPKEQIKTGVLLKPTSRPKIESVRTNLTFKPRLPVKRPVIEEVEIDEDNLPVIQGSFKISKTDADIAEKKNVEAATNKPKNERTTTHLPRKPTIRETSVTSSFYKIASIESVSKPVLKTTTATTTATTTSTTTSTTSSTTTTTPKEDVQSPSTPQAPFISPQFLDNEPWIPIYKETESTTLNSFIVLQLKQPTYTSFTNPALSFQSHNAEKLGSTSLKSHPIPVNKLTDITEPVTWETSTGNTIDSNENIDLTTEINPQLRDSDGSFVEIDTLKYVPGSIFPTDENVTPIKSKWEFINVTTQPSTPIKTYNNTLHANIITDQSIADVNLRQASLLKNLSTIFQSFSSTLGSIYQPNKPKLDQQFENENVKDEDSAGQGQVEVVDTDELSLMMQTTKSPLVTLLPVKSNSGVRRPLRRRPNTQNVSVENRSFPNGAPQQNINFDPIRYIETEVVTSVSSELTKVVVDKRPNDYSIMGVLNFQLEPTELEDSHSSKIGIIHNQRLESEREEIDPNFFDKTVLSVNSSVSIKSQDHTLTPEQLKQLGEISKLSGSNATETQSTYPNGFKILTKTFNKIPTTFKEDEKRLGLNRVPFTIIANKTACNNFTVRCGDGQCLPETTRCNQLVDCNDGADEKNCNCADYLRSQFLLMKVCDGVADCWDFSDENHCDWCSPGQYVCGNSKLCIDRNKICDGLQDCPQADDERQCVTIAPTPEKADEFPYHSEGFLLVRKFGEWGKLCIENFENVIAKSHTHWNLSDLGRAVCKSITYQDLDSVQRLNETQTESPNKKFYEMAYSFQNETKSNLLFQETICKSKQFVKVKCNSLECGARPQAVKQIARIVGGGNAGLGAWPWQAALYKEGEFQCGATLLTEKWLISAGHCFYHSLEEYWVARLGALRRGITLPSPYEQLRPITKIILHPSYVDAGFINDISLLKMDVPVVFSDYVRPICLPPPNITLRDGTMCTVVGWGQLLETGRIFPDTLQEVQVPVISTSECRKRTVFLPIYRVTDDMFCAGFERGGRDACLGDSGGPLMCPEPDGRWVLQGVTSNGYGCARKERPGVYTKVANYVLWINSYINEENQNNSTTFTTKSLCSGHRCPLGECLPKSRLCNSFIECSDGSDEKDCF